MTSQPPPNSIVSTSDRAARPTVSLAPSVAYLASRKVATVGGRAILRAGTELTPSQRREAEAFAEQLKSSLRAAATDQELGRAVVMLLAPYENRQRSGGADDLRLAAYVQALRGFPLWAVLEAVRWWSRGDHGAETDNHAFPPAPPQVVRLVRIAMREPEEVSARVGALLQAEVEGATETPPGERERVAEGLDALSGQLQAGVNEEREKRRGMLREQLARANETARRRLFEEAGEEYRPGALTPSPALRKIVGAASRPAPVTLED